MSIEVVLEGRFEEEKDYEGCLRMIQELAQQWQLKMETVDHEALIEVCPEGYIQISDEDGFLCIAAQTNVAGPGFHAYVCDFFHAIQARCPLSLTLTDPTHYDTHHNFERLVKEVFHRWLGEIKQYLRQRDDQAPLCLSWPVDYYVPKEKNGYVVTPMGYIQTADFLHQDAAGLAERFFVWNHQGRDGAYYRNAALNLLWKECYFEYSNMNEMTEKQADTILDYLEIAHRLDPHLALPMKEYRQLCTIRQREMQIQTAMDDQGTLPIGYRRAQITVRFGHWGIPVPGCTQESVDENTQTLYLTAPYHHIGEPWQWLFKLQAYAFQQEVEGFLEAEANAEAVIDLSHEDIVGRAYLQKAADHLSLHAQCNCGKEVLIAHCIICEAAMVDEVVEQLKQIRYYPIENDEIQA